MTLAYPSCLKPDQQSDFVLLAKIEFREATVEANGRLGVMVVHAWSHELISYRTSRSSDCLVDTTN